MPGTTPGTHNQSKEISHGIVGIYKDYLGRGPTSSRTTIAGDCVTTICEDGLTRAERSLVDAGEGETVRDIRRKFQAAMGAEVMDLVGRVTGRPAKTILSDHDVERDIAVETVILEPESSN